MQLSVRGHCWESFLLDGCRAKLNTVQHAWVENVDTGVDAVSNVLDWLLNEAVDSRVVVWLVDDNTILRWLVNLCDDDSSFISVRLVECREVGKWVVTDDIGVKNEEWLIVLSQNLLCKLEWSGGSERLGLNGECDGDVVCLLVL